MLYGFGDGGGGPHRPMLDRLKRLHVIRDVQNFPHIIEYGTLYLIYILTGRRRYS